MKPTIHADLSDDFRKKACVFLSALDEDWRRLIDQVGPCLHKSRVSREPYEALIRAVAYQQLHTKAGDKILDRFLALYPRGAASFPDAKMVVESAPEDLRSCGFSMAKIQAIQGIAQAALDGTVPTRLDALVMSDESLIQRLVTLRGVGRWTVEMFLIYTLERSDVLPVDDFGVREGYRRLKKLDKAPTPRQLKILGQDWSPYRTVASWYLWRVPEDSADS